MQTGKSRYWQFYLCYFSDSIYRNSVASEKTVVFDDRISSCMIRWTHPYIPPVCAQNSISSCLGYARLQQFGTICPFPPLALKTISVCSPHCLSSTHSFSHYITSEFYELRWEAPATSHPFQNLTGLRFIFCSINFLGAWNDLLWVPLDQSAAISLHNRLTLSLSRTNLY